MRNKNISIKVAQDRDQHRWNDFALSHPGSSPYHLFAWKNAIESAYGHNCVYLYAEKNNQIVGIMPLVHLFLPCFVNELLGLPFCDVGNCISMDNDIQEKLLNYILIFKKKQKIRNIYFRGNLFPSQTFEEKFQTITTNKVRMFLDLPRTSDELMKSFKSKLRSQIRKAQKNGLLFRWGKTEDINNAYYVFSKNMLELGSPVHAKSFLRDVFFHYKKRAKLGLVEYQGKIIGMGIILFGGNSVAIPWASTLREYNRLSPNMLLYWNFLKISADSGFKYFDFGRSSEGEGTYKFKQQWGAKPKSLVWYELKKNKKKVKKKSNPIFNKRELSAELWRKLPFSMANLLGPRIRKYISL